MYVVQTGRTTETKCKEHMRHTGLSKPEKLSMAQHKLGTGHNMEFGNTSMMDIALGYMDCLIQEATDIWLHHRNSDRGRGLISVSPGTQ
jgi:hypothetical protein